MAVTGHGPDESNLTLDSLRDTGYFGSFSSFISAANLESAVGIAESHPDYYYAYESNAEYADSVSNLWMKFYFKGKYLFVPKTPFGWSEWARLYRRGAVFGNDLAWPTNDSSFWRNGFDTQFDRWGVASPVTQNRRVSIGAYSYKVRLLGGQANMFWGGWPDAWCNEYVGADSEWNELIYRTLVIDPSMIGLYNKYILPSGSVCEAVDEKFYYAHGGTHPYFYATDFYWDTIPQTVHQVSLAYSTELWPEWPWRGGRPCWTRDVCWEGFDESEHTDGDVRPVARGGSIQYGMYEMSGVHAHLVATKGSCGYVIQGDAAWLPCLELDIAEAPVDNAVGSVLIPVVQVSGSGHSASYGIISIPLFNLAGLGVNQFTAMGGIVLPKLNVTANVRSNGRIVFPGLKLHGRSYSESFANGTISLGKLGIKGTVILENFGGMHIPMPKLKVSGKSHVLKIMTGSGEIILPAAGVSGVAYNGEPFDFTTTDEIVFKYDPSRGLI
jgi:hypothetical protein